MSAWIRSSDSSSIAAASAPPSRPPPSWVVEHAGSDLSSRSYHAFLSLKARLMSSRCFCVSAAAPPVTRGWPTSLLRRGHHAFELLDWEVEHALIAFARGPPPSPCSNGAHAAAPPAQTSARTARAPRPYASIPPRAPPSSSPRAHDPSVSRRLQRAAAVGGGGDLRVLSVARSRCAPPCCSPSVASPPSRHSRRRSKSAACGRGSSSLDAAHLGERARRLLTAGRRAIESSFPFPILPQPEEFFPEPIITALPPPGGGAATDFVGADPLRHPPDGSRATATSTSATPRQAPPGSGARRASSARCRRGRVLASVARSASPIERVLLLALLLPTELTRHDRAAPAEPEATGRGFPLCARQSNGPPRGTRCSHGWVVLSV